MKEEKYTNLTDLKSVSSTLKFNQCKWCEIRYICRDFENVLFMNVLGSE